VLGSLRYWNDEAANVVHGAVVAGVGWGVPLAAGAGYCGCGSSQRGRRLRLLTAAGMRHVSDAKEVGTWPSRV